MTQAPPSPPNRLRPGRRGSDVPKCGVCTKPLRIGEIHGEDFQLGMICTDCGPHVIAAIWQLERMVHRR
jgi:hypothetical protein